jgi:hypothetical protein
MKVRGTLLLFSSCLIIFLACGKEKQHRYPEDPNDTKQSAIERLMANWQVKAYTLNGKDIIPDLEKIYNEKHKVTSVLFRFYQEEETSGPLTLHITGAGIGEILPSAFTNPDKIRIWNDTKYPDFTLTKWFLTPFKYKANAEATWTITKLYGADLNMVQQTDTGEYKVFFKKQ